MSDRERAVPTAEPSRAIRKLILAALFAALTVVGAYISFPLPFSPVPIVLQNLFVLLAGLMLGPRWSSISIGLYLVLGIVGLPVYAEGTGGIEHLIGPSGGFLFGFLAAAALTGYISAPAGLRAALRNAGMPRGSGADNGAAQGASGADAPQATPWSLRRDILAVVVGSLVIYAFGVPWLQTVAHMSWPAAFTAGMLPFLPGDAIKAAVAILVARGARPLLTRFLTE